MLEVKHREKSPIKNTGASGLYVQGSSPPLVRLGMYESTGLATKLSEAVLKYDKHSEEQAIVRGIWKENIPLALVNIKISMCYKPGTDFCNIVQEYEVGSHDPLETPSLWVVDPKE